MITVQKQPKNVLVTVRGSHVESGRGVMGPDPHHYDHTGRSHTCRTPHIPLWGEYIVSIPWEKYQDNIIYVGETVMGSIKSLTQINQSTKDIFLIKSPLCSTLQTSLFILFVYIVPLKMIKTKNIN